MLCILGLSSRWFKLCFFLEGENDRIGDDCDVSSYVDEE